MMRSMIFTVLFFVSCMEEIPSSHNTTFEFSEIQIAVDKLNNELFIQSYIDYFDDLDSIVSVNAQLYSYYNGGYHFIGEYPLNDDGIDGDFIKKNGRYSILTTSEELDFTDVISEIKLVNMENSFQLSSYEYTYIDIEVIVSGKPIRADFMAVDVWGNVAKYSEYSNVSNNYLEIQVNTDNMYKDIYPDEDEVCIREQFTNDGYFHLENGNIYLNERINNSSNYSYQTKIPFRPLNECGSTGEARIKFVLHDLDFGTCNATLTESCTSNIMDYSESTLWVHGCGDSICISNFENSSTCIEDCQ